MMTSNDETELICVAQQLDWPGDEVEPRTRAARPWDAGAIWSAGDHLILGRSPPRDGAGRSPGRLRLGGVLLAHVNRTSSLVSTLTRTRLARLLLPPISLVATIGASESAATGNLQSASSSLTSDIRRKEESASLSWHQTSVQNSIKTVTMAFSQTAIALVKAYLFLTQCEFFLVEPSAREILINNTTSSTLPQEHFPFSDAIVTQKQLQGLEDWASMEPIKVGLQSGSFKILSE
jgi:hypothetical protein